MQPSLAMSYGITIFNIFPSRGDDSGLDSNGPERGLIAQLSLYASNLVPGAPTNGQILSIAQNTALFAILGTTYGGNGRTSYALPDLRGRTIIGAGQGTDLTNRALGTQLGAEIQELSASNLPENGAEPFSLMAPSLAIQYLIQGSGNVDDIGSVSAFAGNFSPRGWMVADGRALDSTQYDALFSKIGYAYGGSGSTFHLPDLRGRTIVGAGGAFARGDEFGAEMALLTPAQVPEPGSVLLLLLGGAALLLLGLRRRR